MSVNSVFSESEEVSNQSRQAKQKNKIIRALSKASDPLTIPELQKMVRISTPTTIKLTNELMDDDLVLEEGKKETENGRRPTLYTLNINKFYAIGVEILFKRISIAVVRLDQKVVLEKQDKNFRLENTPECLETVISFIQETLQETNIEKEHILGIGIGLTGRVNTLTGESYNFFNFHDEPLAQYLTKRLKKRIYIDNDTHVMGLAEQVLGQAKEARNALILNVSRGLGMTIIAHKRIVTGGMGFAGEFGHMQMGNSEKLCICGKRGCLGMEVSGYALEENFKSDISGGGISLASSNKELEDIRYDDIIEAANEGDGLSINLLQQMGEKLGMALGNIVNLLNPELIIIGGKFAQAGYMFTDSIKTGMNKTALTIPLRYLTIKTSQLGSETGYIGASAMVFKQHDLI
ncbi:ROK family protein [Marinilabilia rubra]|uniref:Glucokinase n=1 Tax=Marinilabilia rubra TaxID=2162893 RepID=A0A2U2BDF8_9BACT|nr:ROK family protein [Marinilabilia rubra]PWE01106.1 glucokinase [Marinilabilia rubra]